MLDRHDIPPFLRERASCRGRLKGDRLRYSVADGRVWWVGSEQRLNGVKGRKNVWLEMKRSLLLEA